MGNTMSEVLEGLFIGNLSNSRNAEQLYKHSITHIVSIGRRDRDRHVFEGIQYLMVDTQDSPEQYMTPAFGECLEFIHRARASKGTVLVHCLLGVSASTTITLVYLLARTNLSVNKAIQVVRAVRPFANPNHGFCNQLEDWSRTVRKLWKKRLNMWPQVPYDDEGRCAYLLSLYKRQADGPPNTTESVISSSLQHLQIKETDEGHQGDNKSFTDSGRNSATSDCDSADSSSLLPITMGNTESIGSDDSFDSATKKSSRPSRLEKIKSALLHKKSNKAKSDNSKNHQADLTNNNNNGVSKDSGPNGIYYSDNITRSTTLPTSMSKVNTLSGYTTNSINTSTLQARLLPAYKDNEQGKIGDIRNRQRIMSSPASYRSRKNSQSSNYSRRYNGLNRVVTTHIPDRIDKRLVRSRSVGVIPDAELRMRRTASASVVKIEECEDWSV